MKIKTIVGLVLSLALFGNIAQAADTPDYERARWDPIHFKPQIDQATDEQCLACHKEVLEPSVLETSPAGVKSSEVQAWYQTLSVYEGPQETFHRRHQVTDLAKKVMDMKCTTCHQGNDPREEAPVPPTAGEGPFTLRKMVNPTTCLMCHGQFNNTVMGVPGPWSEVGETAFQNNCLMCHAAIRTNRHQVNFLKADAIEAAGKENSDVCYGCHGGRSWYRISFPYPRHTWPGAAPTVPDWAKDRPTESEPRFRKTESTAAAGK